MCARRWHKARFISLPAWKVGDCLYETDDTKAHFSIDRITAFCTPFIGSTESQLFETGTCVSQFQLQQEQIVSFHNGCKLVLCRAVSDHGDSKAFTISKDGNL